MSFLFLIRLHLADEVEQLTTPNAHDNAMRLANISNYLLKLYFRR